MTEQERPLSAAGESMEEGTQSLGTAGCYVATVRQYDSSPHNAGLTAGTSIESCPCCKLYSGDLRQSMKNKLMEACRNFR